MKYEYSAGLVTYFNENGQILYLLLHYTAGHWDFPKGIIEEGETPVEAALRELKEEAGITAELDTHFQQPISYLFKDGKSELVSKKVLFFVGKTEEKKIILSDEHVDYKWLSYDEAQKQLTYANAKRILTMAHQYIIKKLQ